MIVVTQILRVIRNCAEYGRLSMIKIDALEWHDWVCAEDIPETGVILARISDNVLDDKHWGLACLVLEKGCIDGIYPVQDGTYGDCTDQFAWGMLRMDIAEWTRFDSTGQHPEEYHEITIYTKE